MSDEKWRDDVEGLGLDTTVEGLSSERGEWDIPLRVQGHQISLFENN